MGKIRRLDESVVGQIAAGEVVERPASVLKELLENSIDAGARHIRVEAEGAGSALLRVADDGEGIGEDDLPLALERHATSKLASAADLRALATLGFRGEALPAIAAVSRLRILSRARGAASGAEISVRGGRPGVVRPAARAAGTLVEVRDLFHNAPARRKFLRSPAGEARALATLVSQFALCHPSIGFFYAQDGRTLLDAPAASSLRERAAQVLGAEEAERLLDVSGSDAAAGLEIGGLVSGPEGARGNRSAQWLYVNGRLVRDRSLSAALHEAASGFIPAGRHAAAYLFLTLEAGDVDVNVHPAKWEVRFSRPDAVRGLLFRAVRAAAQSHGAFREAPAPYPDAATAWPPTSGAPMAAGGALRSIQAREGAWGAGADLAAAEGVALGETAPAGIASAVSARPLPLGAGAPEFLRPLGQFRESFILATDGRDLLIVDQHVAHERILYERILREWEEGRLERQSLLLPLPVELSPEEMAAFRFLQPLLEQSGFRIEPFGEREVILREAPAAAGCDNGERLVRALLEEGEEVRRGRPLDGLRERLAATCACHAAIKIHTPLTREKMEHLLRELLRTRTPFLCPHGRPVVLRLTEQALVRSFGRC
jgi:DNA mismatch repair protein MutL